MSRTEPNFEPMDYPDYRHQQETAEQEYLHALSKEDEDQLTHDKRLEEADDRDEDIANGWEPSV